MMKTLLTVLSITFISISAMAQDVNLKGKVRDAESREPLEFANVALLDRSDSSVVAGGMSGLDGTFEFVAQPGEYLLRVGFIGYQNYFDEVDLGDRRNVNFGTLELASDATRLDEVTVEGVTSIFESDIDKRRYDVENSVVAEGATASELLETLPSIQVDDEGGITMRGSGDILIYINGRPSNLSGDDAESILEQFPANSIKSVELITNPSSRYDAAGVGGIINIILKKNERTGFNGQANVSVGTRDKYNAGINLNYGAGKVNYFASYNYQNRRTWRESEAYRENFIPGISRFLDQDSYGERVDITHLVRGGLDYNVTEKSTIGFYAQGNFRDRTSFNRLNQRSLNMEQGLDSLYVRDQDDFRQSFNFETGLSYDLELDTLGQKLFTSISYSRDERVQTEEYEQSFFNSSMEEVPANYLLQINDRPQTSDLYVFQLDYIKPFLNGGQFESGLKGTFSEWDRRQDFFQGDQGTDFQPQMIDTLSNSYRFKEDVYAGYFAYRNTHGNFGYQGGLRGEYTETIGFAGNREAAIVNNYFNFFPSLYLSYSMGEEEEFTANYSRRISRPNLWSLSPIYRVRDLLNLSIGNPFLQPEFTDSYEFGYMKGWERYLMNATVYHRASTNVLTRVIRLTDENIAIQTRENAARRNSTGFEIVNQLQLNNWWDATFTGNFFYQEVIGDNIEGGFNNSNFSWTVNLLSNMAIPNLFTLQVQGNYRGPIVFPQGELEPYWGINAGIRKNILNDNATISVNLSDIFNTRIFRIRNEDQRFVQDRMFNRETRIGTIAFTWRFGGFRDRNGRDDRDRDFDAEDSDF